MTLKLSDIKKSFGDKVIFDGFSYEFSSVGIYALVGDSGTGKTTLLRMIAGLDNAYKGKIEGGGAKNVSYAFQEHRLFPSLTALENVVVANGELDNSELVANAKAILNLLGFTNGDLNLTPSELSGGMKQRVSLARAFLKKAPILLLDEPTKELDFSLTEKVWEIMNEEAKRRLVIFVSHHTEDLTKLDAVKININ